VLRVRRNGAESDTSLSAAPVRQDVLEARLRTRFCSPGDCTNGPGKISIPGMFDYEGGFSTGTFDGEGSITLPVGLTCSGSFLRGGLPRGRCTLPDGVVYDGELNNYSPSGRGNLISKNGLRVEGTWSGLRATGEVRAVYPDGWVYRGPFSTPNEPNRPSGSYFDASGNKTGEAPLLDPHPTVNTRPPTEMTSRQLFENGKGDVIAKLKKEFPNARILYEQHVEAETRYLTIPLGRPNPGSAQTVIIALLGDSRQVSDVGIVRPGTTTVQWGGNVISTLQVTAAAFASNSLYGQVRARSGATTVNLYVIVMAQ
jgi:hypothetical protein